MMQVATTPLTFDPDANVLIQISAHGGSSPTAALAAVLPLHGLDSESSTHPPSVS